MIFAQWSGKVREFCSDSGQPLCNFHSMFCINIFVSQINFSQIFSPRCARHLNFPYIHLDSPVISLHRMNRHDVPLKANELVWINVKLLQLYTNNCPKVRESLHQKVRERQGFLSEQIAGNRAHQYTSFEMFRCLHFFQGTLITKEICMTNH